MNIEYCSLMLADIGGFLALLFRRDDSKAAKIGVVTGVAALAAVLFQDVFRLSSGCPNPLSLYFQLPIGLVGIAAALHSPGYLDGHAEGRQGVYWFFFNLTLAAMLWVTAAKSFFEFLLAWELMGLFSFVLVAFDWKSKAVLRAAWIYLLACEAGGLLLILLGALLCRGAGSDVSLFVLGMVAFGLKAGFPLLHVWLPEAHPAAPAPVSAVMSAAMIPLGFYGIAQFVLFAGIPSVYGWTFLALGLSGAFLGILFALAQKNLKKLLAYSSIENIGIVSMGLGLGFLGDASGLKMMSVCGFAGAFLHILNHAFLKGTLFLGAGSVFKATGTLDMDRMGGLMKKMPWTGGIFTAAGIGICGLPPFCGFTGELLIYLAAFQGIANGSGALYAGAFAAAVVLAITGGVACATFAKAISAVFLGEPRTASPAHGEERRMAVPLILLFLLSVPLPALAPWMVSRWLAPIMGWSVSDVAPLFPFLWKAALFSFALIPVFLLLLWFRKRLPGTADEEVKGTWDCGFARPTARMEYTATAFSQPLADLFNGILRQTKKIHPAEGLFPSGVGIDLETDDFGERSFWRPLFRTFGNLADKVHKFQSGYLHLYILVMVIALALMLIWGFGFAETPDLLPAPENTVRIGGK